MHEAHIPDTLIGDALSLMYILKGFKDFILRGNVVDLAVGVMIGASFGAVTTSLVKDILTPLIAAILQQPDFSTLAFSLNGTKLMYGAFMNTVVSFLITATAVYFFVVTPLNKIMLRLKGPVDETTKTCPECLSTIPLKARRCAHCAVVVA
ncbi:MAG: large conductance mechanosensitive channel protein MscL [Nitrososphaera sp.]|nr:large conductance mechanosensitive channel protein MscL [Nitrososphaera sp.]